jgi:general L-amino acid transport system permease protein
MALAHELLYVRREEEPILPAPASEIGVVGWARKSLFSSVPNIILTLLGVALILLIVPPILRWAFFDAVWTGSNRDACLTSIDAACWAFVKARFGQFMYGRYPVDERWRVTLTGVLLLIGIVPIAIPRAPLKRLNALYLIFIFPVVALILLTGGHFGISWRLLATIMLLGCLATGLAAMKAAERAPILGGAVAPFAVVLAAVAAIAALIIRLDPAVVAAIRGVFGVLILVCCAVALVAGIAAIVLARTGLRALLVIWITVLAALLLCGVLALDFGLDPVETPLWGGLMVTLVVAIVGMAASMPLGIVLALGRRSPFPIIRACSAVFIEFVRGVPLITVLFMASVMLPLFLPPGTTFDKLLRALVGVALFSAAYMAEVVRGGLQAIGKGQYEAAQALGLGYWPTMRLIVLPQALKIVIPGIVNSFISLFKDTSLVLIIGIFDLLGIVQLGFADANWAAPNTPMTGYIFAGFVFWLFCFSMSRYSIYTERRLNTGHKR